jgi:hypothetical protein
LLPFLFFPFPKLFQKLKFPLNIYYSTNIISMYASTFYIKIVKLLSFNVDLKIMEI